MTLFKLHAEPLKEEWLDAYGHLNEAHYLVPFTAANWAIMDRFVIGADYYERTGGALYTVEGHLRLVKEVRAPALLEIESMVFGSDAKRIRFAHLMMVDGVERASYECVLLHFDSKAGRVTAMAESVQAALKAARMPELPAWAGRGISLDRR
ncbi:MAG: thioesterase family protein [Dongiaceae bacterium]